MGKRRQLKKDLLTPEQKAQRRVMRIQKTVKAFTIMGKIVRFGIGLIK